MSVVTHHLISLPQHHYPSSLSPPTPLPLSSLPTLSIALVPFPTVLLLCSSVRLPLLRLIISPPPCSLSLSLSFSLHGASAPEGGVVVAAAVEVVVVVMVVEGKQAICGNGAIALVRS